MDERTGSGAGLPDEARDSTGTTAALSPSQVALQTEPTGIGAGPAPGTPASRLVAWTAAHPRIPLLLALILAVLARGYLVARTHAMIDGDEALVGIQAERILRGQYPTYFYAQPYMGSLEAYLAAALFRAFGPSAWTLCAVPILLSLLLVYLTWHLARALLPSSWPAAPALAGLVALFAAVPPLYDAVAELRTWGGQIEVYVVTLALLLVTVELSQRLRAGAGRLELARRWALLGFLAGLGIWINPLVSYALAACALWLLPALYQHLARTGAVKSGAIADKVSPWRTVAPMLALLPGAAIGGLPAWVYAAQHGAENLLVYVQQPSVNASAGGAARNGRLFLGAAITARYVTCVAPRVLDGGLPPEPSTLLPLRLALLLPPLAGVVCASALAWLAWRRKAGVPLVAMPLLYAGIITAVFCLGTSAWGATKSCALDYAGRYAVPLALVEPFLLLALFATPSVWAAIRAARSQPQEGLPMAAETLVASTGTHAQARWWTIALVVLLVGGIVQASTYALANPASTFQSPYFRRVSMDESALFTYLRQHHIRYAWANHWVGNIVTFTTDGQTTCADYYDQIVREGLRRPPGSLETVSAADAPSFIITVANPHPLLAQELDAQHIPYRIAVLPSAGVTIITPARTVDPATVIPGLAQDYSY